jgi:AraC family transcriptional regulator of adaptative response/methylated-DNA-[protein]-cysteine methyltransferase
MPAIQEMQRAVRDRDASYVGVFFVAVRTTGVFCRPGCRARMPNIRNVEFFPTAIDALSSGYRPCKKCRPLDTDGRPPVWVEALLADAQEATGGLRDRELGSAGVDPVRARRYFKKHYGMTFQAYHRAARMGQALRRIRQSANLLEVAMDCGYESDSGFREAFGRAFGQTPGRCKAAKCILTATIASPLGPMTAAANDEGVCLLDFGQGPGMKERVAGLKNRFDCAAVPGENEHIRRLREELKAYFAGQLRRFTVPIVYPGTAFQVAVWRRLQKIPYGRTATYEKIACGVGKPAAQRAVGMANHANPIAVIIPCHRVVRKNGDLGGYGGGLWRKQFLLDLERGSRPGRRAPR